MKSLILCAGAVLVILLSTVDSVEPPVDQGSMADCVHKAACQPAGGNACKRKERLDLRFILDSMDTTYTVIEDNGGSNGDDGTSDADATETYAKPYFFCPLVDELQAFSLNHSARSVMLDSGLKWAEADQTKDDSRFMNISVYEMGRLPKPHHLIPNNDDDSSAVIAELNSTKCALLTNTSKKDGSPLYGTLWVNFLVLNITMTKGKFLYDDGFSQPIQSGFLPTCDETDHCKLFDQGHCIGKPGRRNCAKCVDSMNEVLDDIKNIDLKIWASYYGSDADGRKFLSGSENPLTFTQFSAAPIFEKVGGELGSIERKL